MTTICVGDDASRKWKSIKRDNVFYFDCSLSIISHVLPRIILHLSNYSLHRVRLIHENSWKCRGFIIFCTSSNNTVPKVKRGFPNKSRTHSLLLIEVCSCDRREERWATSRRASAPAATHGPIKRSLYPACVHVPL